MSVPPLSGPGFTVPPAPRPDGPPMTLEQFLERHPWPAAYLAQGTPLELLRVFELDVDRLALWPHLADTSSFNRMLGLGTMSFVEENGRLRGTAVNNGMTQSWEELPWEWEFGKGLQNVRLYDRGFTRVVRARFILEETGPGRTRLYVYFGFIPSGPMGAVLLRGGRAWLSAGFERVLMQVVNALRTRAELPAPEPSALREGAAERLAAIRDTLLKTGARPALVDRVLDHVQRAPDDALHRIRVKTLARHLGATVPELLGLFLHATRAGLFALSWDVVCPHCRGVRQEVAHLGEVPQRSRCDVCDVDFDGTQSNTLEVTFRVHPAIRAVEKRLYCAAEPATKPHILLQRVLQPGETLRFHPLLGPGRYRLRNRPGARMVLLDVVHGGPTDAVVWNGEALAEPRVAAPGLRMELGNPGVEPMTVVLEQSAADQDALHAGDLVCCREFRDLFSLEAVPADVHLDAGVRVVMFTDMVGSTVFYEQEGDAAAFGHVRRHFITAYNAVQRAGGTVIKTIGDAVMAVFDDGAAALRASVELQRHFNGANPDTPVRLRITLHSGPCLAVKLTESMDIFGNTVNLCAKLQAAADAGQVTFTQEVAQAPGVAAFLAAEGLEVESLSFCLKWSQREMQVCRVTIRSPQTR